MSKDTEKKDHSIRNGVIIGAFVAVIMAVVTDLNTLFLAHIWPITIHFREYSFNNLLFIGIDVIITLFIMLIAAYIFLFLGMMSIIAIISHAMIWLVTPSNQRTEIKLSWYERIPLIMLSPITWVDSWRKKLVRPETREEAKKILEQISTTEKKEQEQSITQRPS